MILYFEYDVELKLYSNFIVVEKIPYGKTLIHSEWSDIIGLDNILNVWVDNKVWNPENNPGFRDDEFNMITNGILKSTRILKLNRILK